MPHPDVPKAPSTPPPFPIGAKHPCVEHKLIREKIRKLEALSEKTESRRWSLVVAAIGSFVCVVIAIVTMGLFFGDLRSTLGHLERDKQNDRAEIQRLRQEMISTERQHVTQSQEMIRSVTELRAFVRGAEKRIETIEAELTRRRILAPRP